MNKKEIIKQGVDLFNKHFPKDKHTTDKEKTALIKFFIDLHKITNSNSNLANKTIKVLQSKVKTYEQDIINKPLNDMPTNINGRPFKGRL
jgi:SET domain-containing protein|tara:strand:- start:165 stop:434 length:270 start_codon:yes stop_codon:yes gene_type:complete